MKSVPVDVREALKAMYDAAHPAYVADEHFRDKLIQAREKARAVLESAPAPSGEAVSIRDFQIRCHADRDISNALAEAMARLPACPLNGLVSGALQEIEALRYQVAHPPTERDAEDAARWRTLDRMIKEGGEFSVDAGGWALFKGIIDAANKDAIDAARQGEGNE